MRGFGWAGDVGAPMCEAPGDWTERPRLSTRTQRPAHKATNKGTRLLIWLVATATTKANVDAVNLT
jgi:hypothetical protein